MKQKYNIDIIFFVIAFLLAPICVAVLTFWLWMIPVYAVVFGGQYYILFGGPIYWLMMRRYGPDYGAIIFASFVALFGIPIFIYSMDWFTNGDLNSLGFFVLLNTDFLIPLMLFGFIFAPIWGAAFVYLYRLFTGAPFGDLESR